MGFPPLKSPLLWLHIRKADEQQLHLLAETEMANIARPDRERA